MNSVHSLSTRTAVVMSRNILFVSQIFGRSIRFGGSNCGSAGALWSRNSSQFRLSQHNTVYSRFLSAALLSRSEAKPWTLLSTRCLSSIRDSNDKTVLHELSGGVKVSATRNKKRINLNEDQTELVVEKAPYLDTGTDVILMVY